jgi:hypothetical protein
MFNSNNDDEDSLKLLIVTLLIYITMGLLIKFM